MVSKLLNHTFEAGFYNWVLKFTLTAVLLLFFVKIAALNCPVNSTYSICASRCPRTCTSSDNLVCSPLCIEGCECNAGHVLSGDRCVLPEKCGCEYKGQYYQVLQINLVGICFSSSRLCIFDIAICLLIYFCLLFYCCMTPTDGFDLNRKVIGFQPGVISA